MGVVGLGNWLRKVVAALFLIGATVLLGSCGSDRANARFLHAAPGTGNIDILVDGKVVESNVVYGTPGTYQDIAAGTRKIEVRLAGQTTDLVNSEIIFATGSFSTVVIENPPATIQAAVYLDDHSGPSSGQTKLRTIHTAPTLGGVDLYAVTPGTPVAAATPQVTDITFPNQTGYTSLAAGSYELIWTLTSTKQIVIDTGTTTPISLPAGQVNTAILIDAPAGGAPWRTLILNDVP